MLELLLIGLTRLLVGGRAYWLGCAPEPRQRIYFANHTSNLDTVVLWAALPPTCASAPVPSPPPTTGATAACAAPSGSGSCAPS